MYLATSPSKEDLRPVTRASGTRQGRGSPELLRSASDSDRAGRDPPGRRRAGTGYIVLALTLFLLVGGSALTVIHSDRPLRPNVAPPASASISPAFCSAGHSALARGPAPLSSPVPPVVIATLSVGSNPNSEVYDVADADVYVTNSASGTVSVLSGTSVTATIIVGSEPVSATYDGASDDVYVTNFGSDNVSVIHGTAVVGTVPVGSEPDAAAYDGGNGYVYVADYNASNVTILSGTSVVTTVPVGTEPDAAAYDPENGLVYVANYWDDYVSVLNNTSVQGSVPTDSEPSDVVYDSGNGFVYVVNYDDDDVTVINGTVRLTTVNAGSGPDFATYDSTNGDVYVTNFDDGTVTVLNGTSDAATITVGSGPDSAVFDSATGFIFVTDSAAGNVSVLDGSSSVVDTTVVANITVGMDPEYAAYDGSDGDIYVANNASANVSVLGLPGVAQYAVNFTESGLPAGTTWSLTLNGTPLSSTSASIVTTEPNGSYAFTINTKASYTSSPSSGTITVDGAGKNQAIVFTPIPATYAVSFVQSGLPSGTTWSVTFNGSTSSSGTDSITFTGIPNGTFSYTVGALTGFNATPSQGTIKVAGHPVSTSIVFSKPPSSPTTTSSSPSTTGWYGVIGAIVAALVVLLLLFIVLWRRKEHSVTFTQSGLPAGMGWAVTLDGTTRSSSSSEVRFPKRNGSYAYRIDPVAGYVASPASGSVEIRGTDQSVAVKFAPPAS